MDAINISLALSRDMRITAAIQDAAASGILILLPAGSDRLAHPGNLEPARAAFPEAVLVGALDAAGRP